MGGGGLMNKLYLAVVKEIIYDTNSRPTTELRIYVPNLHRGLKHMELPIAKPLYLPGTILDSQEFIRGVSNTTKIYVLFEQGDLRRPRYIGVLEFPDSNPPFKVIDGINQRLEDLEGLVEALGTRVGDIELELEL